MRISTLLGTGVVALGSSLFAAHAQPPAPPPAAPCEPSDARYACDQQSPEDLVALPGGQWVAATAYSGDGAVALIRTRDRASFKVFPAASAKQSLDPKYEQCPGPPTGRLQTHGLYVEPGGDAVHRLFVVGHGDRESIEIIDVDTSGETPQATWVGCVIAPEPIGLNSVRGLPDGGFVTTNFLPRGTAMQTMMTGTRNGELWEWHPGGRWEKVPGSEASGANGVELSADGRTLYVAEWGSQSFFRLSRGAAQVERTDVPLGFRIDNIHWARDGALIGVGQGAGERMGRWIGVRIDPVSLAVSEVVDVANTPEFANGTVAAEVGDRWWIGTFRGDRVAIVPAPPATPPAVGAGGQ